MGCTTPEKFWYKMKMDRTKAPGKKYARVPNYSGISLIVGDIECREKNTEFLSNKKDTTEVVSFLGDTRGRT